MKLYYVPISAYVIRYHEQAKVKVRGELVASLVIAKNKEEATEIAKRSLLEKKAEIVYIGDPLTWKEHMLKVKEDKARKLEEAI